MAYKMGGKGGRKTVPAVRGGFMESAPARKSMSFTMALTYAFCRRCCIDEIIDDECRWDPLQRDISPGSGVLAMIMTIADHGPKPALMNVSGEYDNAPTGLLFGEGITADNLNDKVLASCLDCVYERGTAYLFRRIASNVRLRHDLTVHAVHSDLTDYSIHCNPELQPEPSGAARAEHNGHAKDGRNELLQIAAGFAVDQDGIPIIAETRDGAVSDLEWNLHCLEVLDEIVELKDIIYIADSKLCQNKIIDSIVGKEGWFISRLPRNFGNSLQDRVLETVDVLEFREIGKISESPKGSVYMAAETVADGYRCIVSCDVTKRSRYEEKREKLRDTAKRKADRLMSRVFDTRDDAKRYADETTGPMEKDRLDNIFRLDISYCCEIKEVRGRGRPRADGSDIERKEVWTIRADVVEMDDRARRMSRSEAYVVFITNIPRYKGEDFDLDRHPSKGLSTKEVLHYYKNQHRVESNFHVTKHPIDADNVYIKTESRREALMTVVHLAVLVRGLIQKLFREFVKANPGVLTRFSNGRRINGKITFDQFVFDMHRTFVDVWEPQNTWTLSASEQSRLRAIAFLKAVGIEPGELFE